MAESTWRTSKHWVQPKLCKSSASSSAKALQKLCTKLRTKLCKSSTKGFAAPLSTQCTGHAVDGVCSAQGGPRGSPPWSSAQSSAQSSARSFTWSPIRSSKALLTCSANILGRFCNRPYNNQLPYNRLYKRLYERLYKYLHNRPYKRLYN